MTSTERCAVTAVLTKEQLCKMIDDRLISQDEARDRTKLARVICRLLDSALGLPEKSWHDWDEWAKSLE